MEREGLGDFVMCMTSGRHEGRREGAVPNRPTKNLETLPIIGLKTTVFER